MIPLPRRGSAGPGTTCCAGDERPGTLARGELLRRARQRLAELEVEVDGTRPRRPVERLDEGLDGQRPPGCPAGPRRAHRASAPSAPLPENRPTCSIVWGAPTWCNSGGLSAVQTMSGTRAWCASTTAGWSSAAAVPLVTQITVGLPVAMARPSAKKAALRSSSFTWARRRSARDSARGVDREPGQMTASVTPSRAHSSTRVALKVACTLIRRATPCRGARCGSAPGRAARLHADRPAVRPVRRAPGRVPLARGDRPPRPRRVRRRADGPSGYRRPRGGVGADDGRRRTLRPLRLLAGRSGRPARAVRDSICA